MKEFKIHPVGSFFEVRVSGINIPVLMPYIVVLADDMESALRAVQILAPMQPVKSNEL